VTIDHAFEGPTLPPLAAIAAAHLRATPGHLPPASVEIVCRRRKMNRWLIEYRLTGEREVRLFAKLYPSERGATTYRWMRYVYLGGMCGPNGPAIPRPIGYLAPWRLLLVEKAPGQQLVDCLRDPELAPAVPSIAAAWLRRLHELPIPAGTAPGLCRALADPRRLALEVASVAPDQRPALVAIGERLAAEPPVAHAPRLLHGDFHPWNVFIDGPRAVVIDFDHAVAGDPAADVAYFASQLQVRAFLGKGDFHALDSAARRFVAEYSSDLPRAERDRFGRRLAPRRARSLLEALHYETCVLRARGAEIVEPFLRESELALRGEGFS
jgi:aminoglycoside phosphotransferase